MNVEQIIENGFRNHGYRQGTKECIAFNRGAQMILALQRAAVVEPGTVGALIEELRLSPMDMKVFYWDDDPAREFPVALNLADSWEDAEGVTHREFALLVCKG